MMVINICVQDFILIIPLQYQNQTFELLYVIEYFVRQYNFWLLYAMKFNIWIPRLLNYNSEFS